ncbi:MAG: hypothetical protein H6R12_2535, partial [Proteobacteria bacterium]|nr:hypothetical protein [Pseudomonadota bacterium]
MIRSEREASVAPPDALLLVSPSCPH